MEQSGFPNGVSMQQALEFAKSPAGQQLIQLLQRGNTANLNEALRQAQAGNTAEAQSALSSLLSDPQVRALLKQFGG